MCAQNPSFCIADQPKCRQLADHLSSASSPPHCTCPAISSWRQQPVPMCNAGHSHISLDNCCTFVWCFQKGCPSLTVCTVLGRMQNAGHGELCRCVFGDSFPAFDGECSMMRTSKRKYSLLASLILRITYLSLSARLLQPPGPIPASPGLLALLFFLGNCHWIPATVKSQEDVRDMKVEVLVGRVSRI